MNKIEVSILSEAPGVEAKKMAALGARLTQRGHKVQSMKDLKALYNKPASEDLIKGLCALPHPTLQKFDVINVAVVGASRRFLAQITRHQNEVKFMSASLQYSDYSGAGSFVIPYELCLDTEGIRLYLRSCQGAMADYRDLINNHGVGHDAAAYLLPQGLRGALLISATPYQWKHMIGQRVCKRNTTETRYVMLKIWEALLKVCPEIFYNAGPDCMTGGCLEGRMGCKAPLSDYAGNPTEILKTDFIHLYGGEFR